MPPLFQDNPFHVMVTAPASYLRTRFLPSRLSTDGKLLYWSQRLKTHPMMHATKAKLLQRQQGKCRWCELIFKDGDLMEIDHIQPRSQGGADRIDNIWLLHLHCHDERHAKLAETEKLRKQLADAGINIQ